MHVFANVPIILSVYDFLYFKFLYHALMKVAETFVTCIIIKKLIGEKKNVKLINFHSKSFNMTEYLGV